MTEERNDPTPVDGTIMEKLQQAWASLVEASKLQQTDPDNMTDPVDAEVWAHLEDAKGALKNVIFDQAMDGSPDATRAAAVMLAETRASMAAGSNVRVKAEPRVYTETSPFSYFRDLSSYQLKFVEEHVQEEAKSRLMRHAQEIEVDFRNGNKYVAKILGEVRRKSTVESRAVNTGPTSDGVFVTPQYLIEKWITYRSPDRTFTNQCENLPLPTYGITFNIPSFTSAASTSQQATENTGVSVANPSGSDVSVTLDTFSGYVPVSQQLLDRGGFQGQGGSFDVIVIQQSQSQLFASVDTYLIQQALAGAGSVINNGATATVQQFYLDFGTARNLLADTAGVKLPGTHVFTASDFFGWVTSQVDTNLRPQFASVPDAAALVAVSEDPHWAGWTGIYLPGNYRFFTDDNTTTAVAPVSQYTILVGSPLDMLVWIGDMVPFTAQQTNAQELSVICGLRQYAAAVPRHNEAFAYIAGSAYPTTLV